jgi:hypothetical protein
MTPNQIPSPVALSAREVQSTIATTAPGHDPAESTLFQEMVMFTYIEFPAYETTLPAPQVADDWKDQWECVRRRFGTRLPEKHHCITDLCQAYEEATGMRIGCD